MSNTFWPMLVGAYLLGSVPSAYLAGRWSRGIDIRQYGSGNVGTTNLLRFTSRRTAVPVVVFDSLKGVIMVVAAWQIGLSVGEQTLVGLAAIAGHNWTCFLRFQGGRGVVTTLGVAFVLPIINRLVLFEEFLLVGVGFGVIALVTARFKVMPMGIFLIVAIFPAVAWMLVHSVPLTLGYLGMFLVLILRRLTAHQPVTITSVSRKQARLNRLFFDRDLRDKETWMAIVLEEQENQRKLVKSR